MSKSATSSIEVELPKATVEAIQAYADANPPMTFNEATGRFLSLGMDIEALANSGAVIICVMPEVRGKSGKK